MTVLETNNMIFCRRKGLWKNDNFELVRSVGQQ